MSGKTLSLEPAKSTTEQLRSQLVGDEPREAIFDFLLANPETRYSYSEIGKAVDRHKGNVRKYLLEMEERSFILNGEVYEGLVYRERNGNTLEWQIRPPIRDQLSEPPIEVVKTEREVPRHDSVQSFIDDHVELVCVLLFSLVTGGLLRVFGFVVDLPFTDIATLLFSGGVVGVVTMLVIGYGESRINE